MSEDDNEELTVERRLGKLEGWTKGHQAVCDLRFMIFCAVVAAVGGVLTLEASFGLDSLKAAQAEQTHLLETLVKR